MLDDSGVSEERSSTATVPATITRINSPPASNGSIKSESIGNSDDDRYHDE